MRLIFHLTAPEILILQHPPPKFDLFKKIFYKKKKSVDHEGEEGNAYCKENYSN